MRAPSLGNTAARVAAERLEAGRRVVEIARSRQVDFMLVAGDVFEDNGVGRVLVQQVADILTSFGGPVYIIPGNHDPAIPGSVWEHPAWKNSPRLHVLTEERPIKIGNGLLFPCPVLQKQSFRNPTEWIPERKSDGFRVGLAHGTVQGVSAEEPDFPIPRDAAERAELDYLALGHWHSFATYTDSNRSVRMAYSGTPEPTRFGERDSGHALVVNLATSNSTPTLEQVQTAGLEWFTMRKDLRAPSDLKRAREELETLANPSSKLIDIRLEGILFAEDRAELVRIQELLSARFLWGRLETSGLHPSPEDDSWFSELPLGILREAASRLASQAQTGGADDETALQALLELYAMSKENSI